MVINGPEFWNPRGIGNGSGNCFVTGNVVDIGPDIAGFVHSKEAGQRIVDLFEGKAWLDFRTNEPNWIQVKICVIPENIEALRRIYKATSLNGGIVYRNLVRWAIDPENLPGLEPPFLKVMSSSTEKLSKIREIIGVAT